MPDTDPQQIQSMKMSDKEQEEFLTEQGYGVLSLSNDGVAYGVPISFGFDGERLFFYLIEFGTESKKLNYLETTEEASLVVTDIQDRFDWRSAIVQGRIQKTPDQTEYHEDVLEDNAWFPVIFPPAKPMTGVMRAVMTIDEVSGHKGQAQQNG
jgi:nitroimidazol reductase NimA-like FMN-containing flavoprotein (pyridoxamine 5'-phosphate oxidase superfamily)